MGRLQATEMATHTDLDTALRWHLSTNHYPPIPLSMLSVCKRAIKLARRGEWSTAVILPKGVFYRGQRSAPVSAIIEQHHLESFL